MLGLNRASQIVEDVREDVLSKEEGLHWLSLIRKHIPCDMQYVVTMCEANIYKM